MPCPGLTHLDHPRVPIYLARCSLPCGGAPPRHILRARILRAIPTVESERLERLVFSAERKEARWINNHMSSAIVSPKCTGKGFVSSDGIISCCGTCIQLLHLKTLQNALNRIPCEPRKAKYTPKAFRNPLLGEAFSRHEDVYELVMMVCCYYTISFGLIDRCY